MSEQSKSNYQALGAGLFGFVAVMAVGGGLMLHSSRRASSAAAAPAPAAAPIDLASSMPAPAMLRPSAQDERRSESPAPLVGKIDEDPSADGFAGASASAEAASPSSESAPGAKAPALEASGHLDLEKGSSSAKAVVKNTVKAKKAAVLPGKKALAPAPKLEAAAEDAAVASSVHYGVTSRRELMGRAAGPVYNIKGAKGGAGTGATGKLAGDAGDKLADLRRQLAAADLPEDQRAKLLQELDAARKDIADTGKTTAQ